ncbi:MAG: hypothetical protein NC395_10560 [Prevotella sp.]|nr:hypothetical protein [Prevotella sp.]
MNISAIPEQSKFQYSRAAAKRNGNVPAFTIPWDNKTVSDTQSVQNGSGADPLSAMEVMTGRTSAGKPSYAVTDEEAEYFREKYGNAYSEEKAAELFYELADKGVISENDAGSSSGMLAIRCVEDFDGMFFGGAGKVPLRVKERVLVKDLSFTDENAYKKDWESFKEQRGGEILTWEDAVREKLDFLTYRMNNADSGSPDRWNFENMVKNLEKTRDVIFQIFG